MTTDLAINTTPSTNTHEPVDLEVHNATWTGPAAKVRAATAAQHHDAATLTSMVWGYLHARSPHTSQHTVRSYAQGVRRYVAWAKDHGVSILRPDRNAGTSYRAHLESSMGPGSANTRLVAGRALYAALDWVGFSDTRSPFRHLRNVHDPRPECEIRQEYSPAVVALMYRAAQDPLDRLIVTLAGACGLRASEMRSMTWEAVNLTDATVRIVGKGRKPATVPLSVETVAALRELEHRTGPVLLADTPDRDGNPRPISGATLRYRVARMAAAAGALPSHRGRRPVTATGERLDQGPHRLRHFYGSSLAKRYGPKAAQDGLRHANLATTSRYLSSRDHHVEDFAQEIRLAG